MLTNCLWILSYLSIHLTALKSTPIIDGLYIQRSEFAHAFLRQILHYHISTIGVSYSQHARDLDALLQDLTLEVA